MPTYRVVRPVLLMEAVIVRAKDSKEAAQKVAAGDGFRFYERGREASTKIENMTVEEDKSLNPGKDEKIFSVLKEESYRSRTLIVAKSEENAIEQVKEGDGHELHDIEYRDTNDSNDWTAEEVGK